MLLIWRQRRLPPPPPSGSDGVRIAAARQEVQRGQSLLRGPGHRGPPSGTGCTKHPKANTYTLLLVALLEQGGPMILEARGRHYEERANRAAAGRAALRRVVLRAFPNEAPAALVLLDVDTGQVERFAGDGPDADNAVWCSVYEPEGYLPALVTAEREAHPSRPRAAHADGPARRLAHAPTGRGRRTEHHRRREPAGLRYRRSASRASASPWSSRASPRGACSRCRLASPFGTCASSPSGPPIRRWPTRAASTAPRPAPGGRGR